MSIYQYNKINFLKIFKSLADEMRLRIIRILLRGSFHVNEILYIVNGKQSNISHHLKILQESDLVSNKKEGSLIYYKINDFINDKNLFKIIDTIHSEESSIPCYIEDLKRLDSILNKRKKNAEEFFNTIGKNLDKLQTELFNEIYKTEEILDFFDGNLENILDIGCGTGRNLPLLAKYADKVIGLDLSPIMLQLSDHICKTNDLNYELKQGDIHKLPFETGSINGIFLNMVLHHISDPLNSLKEISRILKNKGKIVLIELLSHQDEKFRENYGDLWLGFTEDEIKNWLNLSDIKIIKSNVKKDQKNKLSVKVNHSIIILFGEKNSV